MTSTLLDRVRTRLVESDGEATAGRVAAALRRFDPFPSVIDVVGA